MDLKDPATLLLSWLVVPAIVALVSAAIGQGVAAACLLELGSLTLPAGFLAGIVLMTLALQLGASGAAATALALVASAPGAVLLIRRLRQRPRTLGLDRAAILAVGAGVAAYALALAPLAGTGHLGVVGYVLNNDSSVHVSVVEHLRAHGAQDVPGQADSSFASVTGLASTGYPLGGHVWVLFGAMVASLEAFYLWTPMIAVSAGMLAVAACSLVRGLGVALPLAAPAGVLVACGFLPFSYVAQGGFKEINLAVSLLAASALFAVAHAAGASVRRLVPAVVAGSAGVAVFSLAGAVWLAPAALAALAVLGASLRRVPRARVPARRHTLAAAAAAAAVVVMVSAPLVASAASFLETNRSVFSGADQVGNLLAPVPWWQAFNVWFGIDYRYPQPLEPGLTGLAVAIAAVLAAVGLVAVIAERRVAALVAMVGAIAGSLSIMALSASIYFEAKALVLLAPAFGLATIAGLAWLWKRSLRLQGLVAFLGAGLAIAVVMSAAMVYSGAWTTPRERFEALADAGRHIPGDGPVLVNDREHYAKYVLRRLRPWNSWDEWQPYRGFTWGEIPPPPPRHPDFDDYAASLIARFPALLERRRPGGSRPPGNYVAAYENRYYRVWRRAGQSPRMHVAVDDDSVSADGVVDCDRRDVRSLLRAAERGGTVRVARTPGRPVTAEAIGWTASAKLEPGPAERFVRRRGGEAAVYPRLRDGQRYRVWIQGAFGPGVRVAIGSRQIGDVYGDMGIFDGWHLVGDVTVQDSHPVFALRGLDRPSWMSGSHWKDVTGPLAFEPVPNRRRMEHVPGRHARALCGTRVDWLELV